MPNTITGIISFNPQMDFLREFSITVKSRALESDSLGTLLAALLTSCVTTDQ